LDLEEVTLNNQVTHLHTEDPDGVDGLLDIIQTITTTDLDTPEVIVLVELHSHLQDPQTITLNLKLTTVKLTQVLKQVLENLTHRLLTMTLHTITMGGLDKSQ